MIPWLAKSVIFPLHERLLGRNTLTCLKELEQVEQYSKEQLQQYQATKLNQLLQHCYTNVPYYRGIFQDLKLTPGDIRGPEDLKKLPFLTKKIIRQNEARLKAVNLKDKLIRMNTGGSSGEPLVFYVDKRRVVYDKASNLRSRKWWGIDIGDKEIVFWGSPIELSKQDRLKKLRDQLTNSKLLSAFNMSEESMLEDAKVIKAYKPKHIFGYPSSIFMFCQFAQKNNIEMKSVGVKVVFVTAEMLYDFQKKLIQETFGCPVANGYGGRDGGFIAHECPQGNMHISENIIVEIIKTKETEILRSAQNDERDSHASGEIAVTHLDNFDMPFIRYRMGDMGRISQKQCTCGRATPILEAIEGRATDFIITPDGKNLHGLALIYILRDIEGIAQFKIIQKATNYLEIKIIRNEKYTVNKEAVIKNSIDRLLGPEVKVDLDYVETIEAEINGKYKYVVSEISGGVK